MPFTGLKIRTEESTKSSPEMGPESEQELFDIPQDPTPADTYDDAPPVAPPPKRSRTAAAAAPSITRAMEREVRDELDAFMRLVALAWSIPDPECAGVFNERSQAIAAALTNLLKRNPRLLASLRATGWLGDWVQLFMALAPVARAVYAHHLAPKISEEMTSDGADPTAPNLSAFPAFLPRNGVGNSSVA